MSCCHRQFSPASSQLALVLSAVSAPINAMQQPGHCSSPLQLEGAGMLLKTNGASQMAPIDHEATAKAATNTMMYRK